MPRYKVTMAHTNENATVYGRTDEVLMDFKSIEMMLRVSNVMNSVKWCSQLSSLRRHDFMTIQLFDVNELGQKTLKIVKIERN